MLESDNIGEKLDFIDSLFETILNLTSSHRSIENTIRFGLLCTRSRCYFCTGTILTHTHNTNLIIESLEQHHFHIKTDEVSQACDDIWSACTFANTRQIVYSIRVRK